MANFNYKQLDGYALNVADAYSFTCPWVDIKNAFAYSFTVRFTGTPTGTLTLQVSNESDIGSPPGGIQTQGALSAANGPQPYLNGLDATTLATTSTSITTSGTTLYTFSYPGYRWVRVVYTGSAATNATATVWCNVKW